MVRLIMFQRLTRRIDGSCTGNQRVAASPIFDGVVALKDRHAPFLAPLAAAIRRAVR
jgi:hypothetical protein